MNVSYKTIFDDIVVSRVVDPIWLANQDSFNHDSYYLTPHICLFTGWIQNSNIIYLITLIYPFVQIKKKNDICPTQMYFYQLPG